MSIAPETLPLGVAPGPLGVSPLGVRAPRRNGLSTDPSGRVMRRLKVGELKTSTIIQRTLNWAWVEAKQPLFDWDAVGPLEVDQLPDGGYYIADGQHRAALIRALFGDGAEVTCWVGQIQSLEEQAARFLAVNDRTKQRPQKLFHVKRIQGDPATLEIVKLAAAGGLVVKTEEDGKSRQSFEITQTACLELLYRSKGAARLGETLKLIGLCWRGDGLATRADFIKGVADFLERYSGHRAYNGVRVVERFAAVKPAEILRNARELAGEFPTFSDIRLLSLALLQSYNKGLRPLQRLGANPDAV